MRDNFLYKMMEGSSLLPAACVIVIFVLLLPVIMKRAKRGFRRRRYLRSSLWQIDHMEGTEFEEYLDAYFSSLGYRTKHIGRTGDFGADLIMYKGGKKYVVQAKRYKQRVGVAAVYEVLGAKHYYKANKCIVVTNSFYTNQAKELARGAGVDLWDRNKLLSMKRIRAR